MHDIDASFEPFLARPPTGNIICHKCTLGRIDPYAMIPAPLAIEDVRRLPAPPGRGPALTATVEQELSSQQAADQTLLVRSVLAKLGVPRNCMHAKAYNGIYGIISETYPWGHTIWQGLYTEIQKGMGDQWKGGPQDWMGEQVMGGYFISALHVSKWDAQREPIAGWDVHFLPAVFVKVSEDLYKMWCQAIVILQAPGWYVHASRVLVWSQNNFFDHLLQENDPSVRTDAA